MTTNKPEVVAYSWQCHGRHSTVDKKFADELVADGEGVDPLIRLSDYEALQAELETVKKVAYGNIELLERNEALQAECEQLRKDAERYRWLLQECYRWPPHSVCSKEDQTEPVAIWTKFEGDDVDAAIDTAMLEENK